MQSYHLLQVYFLPKEIIPMLQLKCKGNRAVTTSVAGFSSLLIFENFRIYKARSPGNEVKGGWCIYALTTSRLCFPSVFVVRRLSIDWEPHLQVFYRRPINPLMLLKLKCHQKSPGYKFWSYCISTWARRNHLEGRFFQVRNLTASMIKFRSVYNHQKLVK